MQRDLLSPVSMALFTVLRMYLQGSSCLAESVFCPQFQHQGHQAKNGIGCVKQIRANRHRRKNDPGIVENIRLPHDHRHQHGGQADEHADHKRSVPVIKPVDRKCRSASQCAAPAAHGFRRCGQRIDGPGDHNRENADAIFDSLPQTTLVCAFADALLGGIDLLCFFLDPGDHPQQDRQKQAQPGADLTEQIHHFVSGKHTVHAGKPDQNAGDGDPQHKAVQKGFQCHIVADHILPQHGDTEMGVAAVIKGKSRHQG